MGNTYTLVLNTPYQDEFVKRSIIGIFSESKFKIINFVNEKSTIINADDRIFNTVKYTFDVEYIKDKTSSELNYSDMFSQVHNSILNIAAILYKSIRIEHFISTHKSYDRQHVIIHFLQSEQ